MTRREQLGIGVLLLLAGYAFGRSAQPARVVERTVEIESTRERVAEAAAASVAERNAFATHREAETTWHPDGRIVVREIASAAEIREVVREVEVVRTVEVERVVYRDREQLVTSSKPAWRVALDLGVADAPHRVGIPGVPRYLPVVVGTSVERRIVGPVSVGAWANTTPSAGVRLAVQF